MELSCGGKEGGLATLMMVTTVLQNGSRQNLLYKHADPPLTVQVASLWSLTTVASPISMFVGK